MKTIKILSLLFIFLLFSEIKAQEFHVAKTGNDANEGIAISPFLTIQKAADMAQPGDIITVHAGIYREYINPPRGGTSDSKRIVYRAAKGEKVTIKGSEQIKTWELQSKGVWKVTLDNSFFGDFNPYADVIYGDWFFDLDRTHHTGAVYFNGHWLDEAAEKGKIFEPLSDAKLWFAEVNDTTTTIWAQFENVNPNNENVEINVRQSVFYPEKESINYITVKGFKLEQAATPWAPPTAEQIGLIGTHWSKGWIIENNEISYSICSGVTLGKYGDEFDNKSGDTAKGYIGTIERAVAYGWSKETVGSHIIRNNNIHHCEQVGIVGSLGAIFSEISGNEVHDIHVKRFFSGMEMGGIKIHAPVDMLISKNYVHHCWRGIWIDWMAQGTRITGNLLHDNNAAHDMFIEVNHGPMLIDNNILLSANSIRNLSGGTAFVHNLFLGIDVPETNHRETPYFKEHSIELAGTKLIIHGDDKYYNNIFMSYNNEPPWPERMGQKKEGNFFGLGAYDPDKFPIYAEGNVYVDQATAFKTEINRIESPNFKTAVKILGKPDGAYLEINMNKDWLQQRRHLVTTDMLGKAKIPDLPFVQADGSLYTLDKDYLGKKRNIKNPAPGPFSKIKDGIISFKVWDRE
ncbi:right-handed parallel beta-helix repeat-containing protein [Cellulophaga sp. Hel_I_12]|uniref:right-handed parallel beta-helix repeat-containing protein n=1 Tax=Cellulophaga sp. Hel_I_12 TaxID=1249972 RepID=UPI00068F281E|nr:right-handed parallel beta-helix repeat-containing protein [Cellulophaga sp. Hel_I_12]